MSVRLFHDDYVGYTWVIVKLKNISGELYFAWIVRWMNKFWIKFRARLQNSTSPQLFYLNCNITLVDCAKDKENIVGISIWNKIQKPCSFQQIYRHYSNWINEFPQHYLLEFIRPALFLSRIYFNHTVFRIQVITLRKVLSLYLFV